MSNSKRDKEYHYLRNIKKYEDITWDKLNSPLSKEDGEKKKRYENIHSKYGNKSMVGNKRRRNSTRKSNQKSKKRLERIARARRKEEVYQETNGIKDIGVKFKDSLVRGW